MSLWDRNYIGNSYFMISECLTMGYIDHMTMLTGQMMIDHQIVTLVSWSIYKPMGTNGDFRTLTNFWMELKSEAPFSLLAHA